MAESTPRNPAVLVVALLCAAIVGLFAYVLVTSPDDEPDAAPPGPSGEEGSPGACTNLHSGHNTMMWNAVMADEMTAAGCPWPYEPFDEHPEGGVEDPTIAVEFEPRLYDDLWVMLSARELGVCQVGAIPEPSGDGFAFGFDYTIAEPGCADPESGVVMSVREYATRAFRDEAANRFDPGSAIVLGRWVVTIDGPDRELAASITEALSGLGAQVVGP